MASVDIGSDYIILSFALTDSFSAITTTRPFVSAIFQEKDLKNVTIRKSASLTTEFNMNGSSGKISAQMIPNSGSTNTIFQAKMSDVAATGTLQVILTLT